MKPEIKEILGLKQQPLRVVAEHAAVLIGCQPHDIPVLVGAGLLTPLGNPAPSCVKYFSSAELIAKAADPKWGHKVTACLYRHWRHNHLRRQSPPLDL